MITIFAKKNKNTIKNTIELIKKIREELLKDDIAKQICKEHNFPIDIIKGIPIDFEKDLEASAKTLNGRIILSEKLIDEDFEVIMRYAIHELVHSLQHMQPHSHHKKENKSGNKETSYLDIPAEEKAFAEQLRWMNENNGDKGKDQGEGGDKKYDDENDVKTYLLELLEYHKIPKNKRIEKAEELLKQVSKEDPDILKSVIKDLKDKANKNTSKKNK